MALEQLKSNPKFRELVAEFSEVNSIRQSLAIAFDWIVILVAALVASHAHSVLVYMIAVVTIAARQHALLVMMHEGAHFRISRNRRMNDLVSDWFCAYPTLMTTQFYRTHHLKHHQHTNTDLDPDWSRKRDLEEWQFPKSRFQLASMIAKCFLTGGYDWLKLTFMITRGDRRKVLGILFVVALFLVSGNLEALALYWFVPLLTVFPVLQRLRSIAEHFGIERESELNGSRETLLNPLESFVFAPHCVHMHLTHHLFPSIPQYRLRAFHEVLMKDQEFSSQLHLNNSYFWGGRSVLNDLLSSQSSTVAKTEYKDVS